MKATGQCLRWPFAALPFAAAVLAAALPPAETHVYKRIGSLAIRADVHRPDAAGPRPVVVYFHGGSLINGRRESVRRWAPAEALVRAGVVVVSADYRLAPESKLPAIVSDLEDVFRWVRAEGPALFGADPTRVAVAGSSAGGYLALVAGHRVDPRPRAILAEMSYGDLLGEWQMKPSVHPPHYADSNLNERDAWAQVSGPPVANAGDRAGDGGAFNDFIRRTAQWPRAISGWDPRAEAERYLPYLPARNVTREYPPTFLLHGRADSDVPFSQPQQMAAEFAHHGVEHRLVGVEGAEHGWRDVDPARVAAVQREGVEFLLDHLEPAAGAAALPPTRTFVFKRVGDLAIRADVNQANAAAAAPVVVWIHGGGLMGGNRERDHAGERQLVDRLLADGITVVSIDYRLAPETKLPDIVSDVEDAFRWVRTDGPRLFGADPQRIAAVGTSAGGYLALLAAYRVDPRPRAIVSFWGYGDITAPWYSQPSPHARHRTIMAGEDEARRAVSGRPVANAAERAASSAAFYQYCRRHGLWPRAVTGWDPATEAGRYLPYLPLRNVDRAFPPTFLVHGEADTDVPCEQSALMAAELKRHDVEHVFIPVAGAEHGLKGSDPALLPRLELQAAEFLRRHLRSAPPSS